MKSMYSWLVSRTSTSAAKHLIMGTSRPVPAPISKAEPTYPMCVQNEVKKFSRSPCPRSTSSLGACTSFSSACWTVLRRGWSFSMTELTKDSYLASSSPFLSFLFGWGSRSRVYWEDVLFLFLPIIFEIIIWESVRNYINKKLGGKSPISLS